MKQITALGVIPVCVIDNPDHALPLAAALIDGGIPLIEITLRTPSALECIRSVRGQFPEMLVGAGTVISPAQVDAACEAGAMFGVSPGLCEPVVMRAKERGLPFFPGVMTPSDIERGLNLGCMIQKFFPAEAAGGVGMLKALSGPYASSGVSFIPLGGLNPRNAGAYLELPVVAAIGGTWIAEASLISRQDWAGITQRAREAVALVAGSRASKTPGAVAQAAGEQAFGPPLPR